MIEGFGQDPFVHLSGLWCMLRLDATSDGIQDLAYWATLTPLAGYYLIKHQHHLGD